MIGQDFGRNVALGSILVLLGIMWVVGWVHSYFAEPMSAEEMCREGQGSVCLALGLKYQRGDEVDVDMERAVDLFERACKRDVWAGCVYVGQAYAEGRGGRPKAMRAAIRFYEQACVGGEMVGCYQLGHAYWVGNGVKENEFLAVEYFSSACAEQHSASCFYMGVAYAGGRGLRDGADRERAATFFERACADGQAEGCFNLARVLEQGAGAASDGERVLGLFQKSCEGGFEYGCEVYGERVGGDVGGGGL